MFARGAFRCVRSVSRNSSLNLLKNAAKLNKAGTTGSRRVSSLSATLQSSLLRGALAKDSSILAAQDKYGKRFGKNLCAIAAACNTLNSPQVLVGLLLEGIGSDLLEDDDEMSSVTVKEKNRRKQEY